MEEFNTLEEILEFAVAREVEANQLYTYMAEHVTNAGLRGVCEEFAEEELEHKAKLELEIMKTGKVTADINIADYVVGSGEPMELNYEELLIFAISKEEKSIKLYKDLAQAVENEDLREVFLALVQEEAEHKNRFEREYHKATEEN